MDTRTSQNRVTHNPNDLEYALASLGRTTISNEHLRAENASLRAQLDAMSRDIARSNSKMLFSPTPFSQDTSSTGMVSATRHDALARKYAELEASHAALKAQNEIMRGKLKESKTLVKQWQVYLRQKKEKDGGKRGSETVSSPLPPAPGAIDENASAAHNDIELTPRASAVVPEPVSVDSEGPQGRSPEMTSSPPRLTVITYRDAPQPDVQLPLQLSGRITSSQATVDDLERENDAPLQVAPSSDFEPIFVSTRCLKRKLGPERGLESPVRRIKLEHTSPSMPINLESGSPQRAPQLTIDTTSSDDCLDNFGPAMITPRRPKRVDDLRQRATSEEAIRPVPHLRRSASSFSDSDASTSAQQLNSVLPEADEGTRRNESCSEMNCGSLSSRASANQDNNALKPISGNVPRQQRTPEGQTKPKAKSRRTGARDKILLVSEDGDDIFSQSTTRCPIPPQKLVSPVVAIDGRLDSLLNGPSPKRNPVVPHLLAPTAVSTRKLDRPAPEQLRSPVSVVKRISPVKTTSLGRTPVRAKSPPYGKLTPATGRATGRIAAPGASPLPVRPEEEMLRIRPVSTLRLEDFKINPKYMGTDFAFADTIRGRDARQNLHACTRADCCGGALEKVIKMGGTAMSGRTDADALRAFVGPAWEALIGAKRPNEAKQLVQQAHAFCFANEHGKHRQAFERRSTPPGYWRADFPTTQEQAVDRKTADEMQRKEVEDRHREALREGGRWIFRDE